VYLNPEVFSVIQVTI